MNQPPPSSQDARYLILVGGLLLLICFSLGVLWMVERNRRMQAEARLRETQDRMRLMTQFSLSRFGFPPAGPSASRPASPAGSQSPTGSTTGPAAAPPPINPSPGGG